MVRNLERTFIPPVFPIVWRQAEATITDRQPFPVAYAVLDQFSEFRDVKTEGFGNENEASELFSTCNHVVESNDGNEAGADKTVDLPLEIMKLAAGGKDLPV